MTDRPRSAGGRRFAETPPAAANSPASSAIVESGEPAPTFPFRWFMIAVSGLKQIPETPRQIDRSIWHKKYFGAGNRELLSAFRFLRLVADAGRPTHALRSLVDAFDTDAWPGQLTEVLKAAYRPVFVSDPARLSAAQVFEIFKETYGLRGVSARKAVTFFLQACKEAGVDIGPFVAARRTSVRRIPQGHLNQNQEFAEKLLDRLPPFDSSWNENLKGAWLSAFSELVERTRA